MRGPDRLPEQVEDIQPMVCVRRELLVAGQKTSEPGSLQVHVQKKNVPAASRQRVGHIHHRHAPPDTTLVAVKGEDVREGHRQSYQAGRSQAIYRTAGGGLQYCIDGGSCRETQ